MTISLVGGSPPKKEIWADVFLEEIKKRHHDDESLKDFCLCLDNGKNHSKEIVEEVIRLVVKSGYETNLDNIVLGLEGFGGGMRRRIALVRLIGENKQFQIFLFYKKVEEGSVWKCFRQSEIIPSSEIKNLKDEET